jgi:hypothetical protein
MGSYAGHALREAVVDGGQRYIYSGIAPRCHDGSIDVDALAPGEFVVPPGLIYRLETMPEPWWRRLIDLKTARWLHMPDDSRARDDRRPR